MTIHAELEAIRERVEGATEGPWRVLPESEHRAGAVAAMEGVVADVESPWEHHDATFIAHARTDLPRLLDAVEKVLELHESTGQGCWECYTDDYPCPTVQAINTALEAA